MALDSSTKEIKISSSTSTSPSTAYYHDHLNLLWAEVKRSPIYERVIFHGISCTCCQKIRNPVLDIGNKKKTKQERKEVHRI